VSNLNAAEHLKIARRLHFQGQTDEAVREYMLVLEIDPDNEDARSGLISLGVEPPDTSRRNVDGGSAVKTNFFVNQAKSSELPAWRTTPFKIVIALLAGLALWGVYQGVTMFMNFDNIKAANNVDAHIAKIKQNEDGGTEVNVKIKNDNPAPIKKLVLQYQLLDAKGNVLKASTLEIPNLVPAGDERVFEHISVGELKDKPDKITDEKIVSLIYGPKPKIKDRLVDRFVEASDLPDKDSFAAFDELTQDLDDFPPALVGMGRAYAARGDWKRAIGQFDKAIEYDPESAQAHYYKAVALFYTKDKENAKKEMEKALELSPDDPKYQESARQLGVGEGGAKASSDEAESSDEQKADEKKSDKKDSADDK
jgi:tetratricopeptide (TPR) repeat protein